jgi:hypothetical protein
MIDSSTEIVSSFKDKDGNEMVITGKNAYMTEFNVNYTNPEFEEIFRHGGGSIKKFMPSEPITITMEFKLTQFDKNGDPNYIIEQLFGGGKPKRKISHLRVEDCTIEELLFAARQKIK